MSNGAIKSPKDRVKSAMKRLSKLNAKARATFVPADRTAYLVALYRAAGAWAKDADKARLAKRLEQGVRVVPNRAGFVVALLNRTSHDDDRRLRFKHGAALQYAASKGITSKTLPEFLKNNGGFNGCAARFSDLKKNG